MKKAPIPSFEEERLKALMSLNILDTAQEERFDRLTIEASEYFKVPISTITLIDKDREWYKSHHGLKENEGPRTISFCGHTILNQSIFIIEDTKEDSRFADNPMVIGPPYIRFYAGVTLFDRKSKMPVGAFCIKDVKPRALSLEEVSKLMELAKEAENELNKNIQ